MKRDGILLGALWLLEIALALLERSFKGSFKRRYSAENSPPLGH